MTANKTDQEIDREKAAVEKMIGAKAAMASMIERHDRLVSTLRHVANIADDMGKRVGEDLLISTFHHGDRAHSGTKAVSIRSQLATISDAVRKVV